LKIAKEDLLWIRTYIAEKHHKEFTPEQVLDVIREVRQTEVSSEPGLVTLMKMDEDTSRGDQ
jgi:hypothetical protein